MVMFDPDVFDLDVFDTLSASSLILVLKYELSSSSGVVGESPYQVKAKLDKLHSWKFTDKLNKLATYEFTVPNDEFYRANAIIERNAFVPFLKPFRGIVCKKRQDETSISLVVCELAFHLTRRIYRKNSLPRILYGAPTTNIQFEGDVIDVTSVNDGTWTGTETYTFGKMGQAGDFDGSSFVTLANESAFDYTYASKFSVSLWVKTTATGAQILVSKKDTQAGNGAGWVIFQNATDDLVFKMPDGSTNFNMASDDTINDGKWHHVTFTYNGSSNENGVLLYVDGVLVHTGDNVAWTGSPLNALSVIIGDNSDGTAKFTGQLDDVRIYPRTLSADMVTDVFKQRTNLTDDHDFQATTAANVLAQDILTHANTDMPSDITWKLSPNFPTGETILEFHYQNHYQALNLIAETLGKDLFFDNKAHLVFIETKGKTLGKDEELDIIITSKPEISTEDFANDINLLGKKTAIGEQLEHRVQASTVLRFNYEKVVADSNLNSQDQLSDIGDALLTEFQKLTPQTKGEIPVTQFHRLALSSGDIVKISQPNKQLSGDFRVMDITVQPNKVKLSLEKTDTAIVRVRSSSLTDVIDGILKRLQEQSIET